MIIFEKKKLEILLNNHFKFHIWLDIFNFSAANGTDLRMLCNFNLRDVNGDTPICLALNEGFNHLVPLLIQVSLINVLLY